MITITILPLQQIIVTTMNTKVTNNIVTIIPTISMIICNTIIITILIIVTIKNLEIIPT